MAGGKKGKKKANQAVQREKIKRGKSVTTSDAVVARDDGSDVEGAMAVPTSRGRLSKMVPMRFDSETLGAIKRRAAGDRRSVSSWIRRGVDLELDRPTTA
jgi:hypothetical protein